MAKVKTKVSVEFHGPEKLDTYEARAYELTVKGDLREDEGPEKARGEEARPSFDKGTLVGIGLAKDRLLFINATGMEETGRYKAVPPKDDDAMPTVFYVAGENIYFAEDQSAEVEVTRSERGIKANLKKCRLKLMNLEEVKGEKKYRTKQGAPNRIVISASMAAPVPVRKLQVEAADVKAERSILEPETVEPEPVEWDRKSPFLYCAYCFAMMCAALAKAASCFAQWWNPFAWIEGARALAEAYYWWSAGHAAGCW